MNNNRFALPSLKLHKWIESNWNTDVPHRTSFRSFWRPWRGRWRSPRASRCWRKPSGSLTTAGTGSSPLTTWGNEARGKGHQKLGQMTILGLDVSVDLSLHLLLPHSVVVLCGGCNLGPLLGPNLSVDIWYSVSVSLPTLSPVLRDLSSRRNKRRGSLQSA